MNREYVVTNGWLINKFSRYASLGHTGLFIDYNGSNSVSSHGGRKRALLGSLLQSGHPVRFLKSNEHKLLADEQRTLHQHTVR